MRLIWVLAWIGVAPSLGTLSLAAERPYVWAAPKYAESAESIADKHIWISLAGDTSVGFSGLWGASLQVGYQWTWVGLDLRGSVGVTNFGSIHPAPSFGDIVNNPLDPTAEIFRPRTSADAWQFEEFEPGVSATGRLMPELAPLLSERVRFGLGYGFYDDQINALVFAGFLWSFEATLEYHLSARSPFAISAAADYRFGSVGVGANPLPSGDQQLALSFLTTTLSLAYWF